MKMHCPFGHTSDYHTEVTVGFRHVLVCETCESWFLAAIDSGGIIVRPSGDTVGIYYQLCQTPLLPNTKKIMFFLVLFSRTIEVQHADD